MPPTANLTVNLSEQFDRYYPAVHKYFRYRGADPDLANDLAAVVFERALTKLSSFDPRKGGFGTWLFAIARHTAINHWKAQRTKQDISIDFVSEQSDGEPLPEEVVIQGQSLEALLAALSDLEERQREIVALKFGGALNNRQIASLLGLTDGNVGVILYRALQKIKEKLSMAEGQVRYE
ncbi:MAG: sigma-70 family RNA polymerase sigma factor [Anaerolineaceae bacterium]|nr:sigma-70 family RNA polymerase sigma factor [Anaerolineaceae bacterium]